VLSARWQALSDKDSKTFSSLFSPSTVSSPHPAQTNVFPTALSINHLRKPPYVKTRKAVPLNY
jgi:hypothetical protein